MTKVILNYWQKPLGKLGCMYLEQRRASIRRNHPEPDYTKTEFIDWAYLNGFEELYTTWMFSEFDRMKSPSADRLDSTLPYTLDNLDMVTWKENNDRSHQEAYRHGKLILQMDLEDNVIEVHLSTSEASRTTGIDQVNLSTVARKRKGTAGGYKWCYLEEDS